MNVTVVVGVDQIRTKHMASSALWQTTAVSFKIVTAAKTGVKTQVYITGILLKER